MDRDTIVPAIAFRPVGVIPYDGSPPNPPDTRFFRVNGLEREDPMYCHLFDESSPYRHCFSVSSPIIIGRDTIAVESLESQARSLLVKVKDYLSGTRDSCVFVADDLGGSVAKLALVIAAEEAEYRNILDATQAVIFFGTPHRGSPKHSLDSAVHSVVAACFQGILGDWFPETLNSLTRRLEDIDQKFRHIAHKFSVASYYQTQPTSTSGPYQVIVPKECATLGLETETTIGVSRAYSGMRLFMHRHEAYVAQVFLENSKIRHWDEFKHSMDILLPAELGAEYDGRSWLLQRSPIPPSSFHRDNPDFSGWVSQESSRYLSLALRNFADPPCLLSAAAKAIQEISDIPWIDCLSTALYGPVGGSPGKSYVLASLIRQILTQQPLAFLHIRHLLPNLVNAMRGDMQAWKERCLWLCLRTLIHSPVRPAMYGFLHVETEESIEILRQIDSALDGTESRLRLVLVLAPGVVTGIRSSYFVHSDLSSNDGLSANTCNTAAKDTTLLSQSDMESLLLQKLQLSLGAVERSDFIALIWVAFATRPLYLGELETAAALDQVQRSGTTSDLDKESLGVRLRDLLPEFIEIDANRIFLRLPHRPIREVLNSSKPPGHDIGEDWSPHRYMAERCLALVKEIPKSAHDQLATSFTVYATQNWIYHYEMAGLSNTTSALEVSQGGSDIINEESTVQSWLTFVEYLSFPPSKRRKYFQPSLDISEPRLKNLLDISKTKDLKILFKLASRPSTLSGLGKLLVHAAETANNDILDKIYMEPFTPEQVEAVSRALATSHGTIHDTLMQRAASILDEDIIFRIQLEALVLGNTEVSKTLVSKLLLLPNAGERGLVTDVLIAGLEYGDESVIDDLCNWSRDAPWHHNVSLSGSKHYAGKDLTNWSILHAAAKYGNEKTVSRILGSGFLHDIRSIQGLQSPLFIAAAQGFPLIVDCLISSGALVDSPNADQQMSALHVASLLGHWATADTLLRQGADPTTSDAKGNYPLHLAIRQGHSRVAEMLVHHFPAVSELHDEANDGTSMEALDRDLGQEQTNPDDGTVPDSSTAAVNYANMYGVTALAEAADRELAGVCELILQRGGDPNIRDDAGRVALHLAAKAGSASIARDLINRGSTTDQVTLEYHHTPMHYACYRGATEVVDLLMSLTDLRIEDDWGHMPISAAAYAGHLEVVKLLYESYDDRGRAQALCAAASQSHRKVVEYLLDSGCSVNGVSPGLVPLLAVHPKKEIMIQLLVQRAANLELKDDSYEQAIHLAAENGAYEATKLLLDHGSPLETETRNGSTPLSLAIYWHHPKVVRLLLERNAKIRLPRCWDHYSSVLDFAMGMSTKEVIAILLGYYINGKHQDGLTSGKALAEAIKRGNDKVTDIILKTWLPYEVSPVAEAVHYAARQGGATLAELFRFDTGIAAIDAKMPGDPAAGTPLHAAILNGRKEAMHILLEAGADRDVKSDRYGTILNTACVSGKKDMVRDVLTVIPKTAISIVAGKYGTPFQSAVYGFKSDPETIIDVFNLLEEHGASPSAKGGHYSTPLHAAIDLKSPVHVVVWLMERSPGSLVAFDIAGRIPLSVAILKGGWDIVKAVLEKTKSQIPSKNGSPTWVLPPKDHQNLTLLHYAVMSQSSEKVSGILSWVKENTRKLDEQKDLLQSLINAIDVDGWTPLHWACRQSGEQSSEIVKILLDNNAGIEATTGEGWTPRQVSILHGFENAEYINSVGVTNDETVTNDQLLSYPRRSRQSRWSCNMCYTRWCWMFYHCQNDYCYDFDLCFKCYKHVDQIHFENHEFCAQVLKSER